MRHAILAVVMALAAPTGSYAQAPASPPGRLLASNCFQCHGTDGRGGFDRLAGKSSNEIYNELREMKAENKPMSVNPTMICDSAKARGRVTG